jgi:3-oxoacid CoA-transferase subunit A
MVEAMLNGVGKVYEDAAAALADLSNGASIACGGFGMAGAPMVLMRAVVEGTARDLEIISNNGALADWSMGPLLAQGRVRRVVATHIGSNRELQRHFNEGRVEIELTPQGTFVERLRAGGHGIAAFYTPTGVGTYVESGGLPQRYSAGGEVVVTSAAREVRDFGGRRYVLETALRPDFSLVHAWRADRAGNLVFRKSSRNFNPAVAMAGHVTIAEVEELVEVGAIDPDAVHLPGIFVDRIVEVGAASRRIEQVNTRARAAC